MRSASTVGARFISAPPRKARSSSRGKRSAVPPAAGSRIGSGAAPPCVQTGTSRRASRLKGLPSFAVRFEIVQAIVVFAGSGLPASLARTGTWKTRPSATARIRGRPASNVSWGSRKRSVLPAWALTPRTRISRSGPPLRLASSTAPVRTPGISRTIRGRRSTQVWTSGAVAGSPSGASPSGWSSVSV